MRFSRNSINLKIIYPSTLFFKESFDQGGVSDSSVFTVWTDPGVGMSAVYKEHNVGQRALLWGTPAQIGLSMY